MAYQFIEVNGARLYCDVQGEGEPLVLIHSGLGHMEMWNDQMEVFSQCHRVIRYDVRGWGLSQGPLSGYSDHLDLYELLRHLGIERTALLGCSSGGGIAIDFTLAYPEMVSALIAVAPSVSGYKLRPDELMTQMRSATYEAYQAGDKGLAAELTAQLWFDGPGRSPEDVDPAARQRALDMIRSNFELPDRQAHPKSLEPLAARRLAQISAPTLLIIGDKDVVPMATTVNILETKIPGAKKVVIQGAAHFSNMEKPVEFNRIVLDFLKDVKAGEQRQGRVTSSAGGGLKVRGMDDRKTTPNSQNEAIQKDLLDLLSGRKGHFKLESGYHGDLWFDLDRLYLRASSIQRFIVKLASQLSKYNFTAVCGPLSGGAFLAQSIAAELDLEFYYTERIVLPEAGGFYPVEYHLPKGLRKLAAGKQFAIVDDIINAGSAARGTFSDLQMNSAKPVVVAALLMLGSAGPAFFNGLNIPMESVAQLPSGMWEPAVCPLCASKIPLEDPYL